MKLRNKKTGEIRELPDGFFCGDNLKKICKDWEDYEEPKEYWYYDTTKNGVDKITHLEDKEKDQEIGNYFESKEEAEKAVEKLKAWKRMKDTGCKPITWKWKQDYPNDACYVEVVLKCQFDSGIHDRELDLLFGGEDD